MKKTISIVGSAGISLPAGGDSTSDAPLFDLLEKEGFSLSTSPDGDFLLAINDNRGMYGEFIKSGGKPERTVLLRLEPLSVFPAQYKPTLEQRYGLVITPGEANSQALSNDRIGWPYQYHLNPGTPKSSDPTLEEIVKNLGKETNLDLEKWGKRQIPLSMIAGNKVSPLKNTNYSLRRKLAKGLPQDILRVYGPLWNDDAIAKLHHRIGVSLFALRQGTIPSPVGIYGSLFQRYSTAHGTIANKHAVLKDSKFSIVIENSNSTASEKLFDAILNGVVPIYIGPKLEEVGLPSDLAITFARSPQEIENIVRTTSIKEVSEILKAGQEFLASDLFWKNWTANSVYRKIVEKVVDHFGTESK